MTTEVWIPGFRQETLITIPDNQRLDSAQKSSLIRNLEKFFPPSNRCTVIALSPQQLGQIKDKINETSISTPSKVVVGTYDPDTQHLNPNLALTRHYRTWNKPITCSGNTLVGFILPGYSSQKIERVSFLVRNISSS